MLRLTTDTHTPHSTTHKHTTWAALSALKKTQHRNALKLAWMAELTNLLLHAHRQTARGDGPAAGAHQFRACGLPSVPVATTGERIETPGIQWEHGPCRREAACRGSHGTAHTCHAVCAAKRAWTSAQVMSTPCGDALRRESLLRRTVWTSCRSADEQTLSWHARASPVGVTRRARRPSAAP